MSPFLCSTRKETWVLMRARGAVLRRNILPPFTRLERLIHVVFEVLQLRGSTIKAPPAHVAGVDLVQGVAAHVAVQVVLGAKLAPAFLTSVRLLHLMASHVRHEGLFKIILFPTYATGQPFLPLVEYHVIFVLHLRSKNFFAQLTGILANV